SPVLMPDVLESASKDRLPTTDEVSGIATGAVIGHQQFPTVVRHADLSRESPQHRVQRIRPVVGRNNDGELHTSTLGQSRARTRLLELRQAAQHSTSPLTPTTAHPVTYGPSPAISL